MAIFLCSFGERGKGGTPLASSGVKLSPSSSTPYAQFYKQDEFCHYNMFNHHFFDGEASGAVLQAFLAQGDGQKAVMVSDPPFDCSTTDMPMMWIFPYFFEPRILECLPSFTMLDYQVHRAIMSCTTIPVVGGANG
ncbi:Zinc finger CCHC domain-containing protein 4 [Liparis tanakae]|uniref:Zinc finger CCHC domain-containing protein 4 n=1 Tax=Liparis tanakae TaxID=230148 RepID=A0A4Z2EDF5_9TELE|nr:Zinc finger CCHC domain-containing protein 4 [Liparis tanakae]